MNELKLDLDLGKKRSVVMATSTSRKKTKVKTQTVGSIRIWNKYGILSGVLAHRTDVLEVDKKPSIKI